MVRAVHGVSGTIVALLCSAAASTIVEAQPADTFFDSVEVPLAQVEVTVTNQKGRAVMGLELGRDDFELYVGGERVDITNFSAPSEFLSAESGDGDAMKSSAPGTDQERSDAPEPSSLTVAIYLDELNLHPPHRARLLTRLRAALEPWRGTRSRFLLATMRDRLEVLTPLTTDVEAIHEAVAGRPKGDPRAIDGFGARRRALQELVDTARMQGPLACSGGLLAVARQYASEQARRAAIAADGLADLVTTLSGVSGRKVVVYMSDGLPQRPGISLFDYIAQGLCQHDRQAMSNTYSAMLEFDETSRLQRLAAHANANRVTLFPIDAAGVRPGLAHSLALDRPPSFLNDNLHRTNVQGGLHVLADETGGKLLANSNDLVELFDDVSDEIAATYTLGFAPEAPWPGEVKRIDVLLAPSAQKKGLRVRHRASYRFKTQDERLAERLLAVGYLGSGQNPFDVTVGFQPTRPAEGEIRKKTHELVVEVHVPRAQLAEVAGAPVSPGRQLRVWLLAIDQKNGARTPVRQKMLTIGADADRDGASSGNHVFHVEMELPEGEYDVAVGARDELTGMMSLVRDSVTVPFGAPAADGTVDDVDDAVN